LKQKRDERKKGTENKEWQKEGEEIQKDICVCVCEDNLVISFCLIWKFSLTKDIKCNFLFNEDKVKKND
jgi:hypothetical protein